MSKEEIDVELRDFRVNLTRKDTSTKLHIDFGTTDIDYNRSGITPGGARMLVVERPNMPFSEVIGTAKAWDTQHRAVDLAKLTVSMSVKPRSCYMQTDRSDEGFYDGCAAFLLARSTDRNRIYLYFFQKDLTHLTSKAIYVYQRQEAP